MNKDLVEIKGFAELKRKISKLDDRVKRREMLKILGQVANPTVKAARSFTPVGTRKHTRDNYGPGNLKRSIGKRVGKKGNERINAAVYVAPRLKGKFKGWYAHFIALGTRVIAGRDFMKRAYNLTQGKVTADAENRVTKYVQKQINRLSNV